MHLENIKLTNFKNYATLETGFSPKINCILGENGSGKTNLLDAIHYLTFTKSAFNKVDSQNIKHNDHFFFLRGDFLLKEKKTTVQCSFQQGQKKQIKINQKPYEKISDHIGKLPVVIITPDDQELVREGSETRRRFFDSLISQIDQLYLENLITYYKILRQRNALLKQFAERNYFDKDLLQSYTKGIVEYGMVIFKRRSNFVKNYLPVFRKYYFSLTNNKEAVDLIYQSDCNNGDLAEQLEKSTEKDSILQRTTKGIHKDDFDFQIDQYALKKFGSQGQQKSFVVSLKLAELEAIKNEKTFSPIFLLDDIFDKLDEIRINRLIEIVTQKPLGQLFITDARPERTQNILKAHSLKGNLIFLKDGNILRSEN